MLRIAPIVLVLLALAGCGGGGEDGDAPTRTPPRAAPPAGPEDRPRSSQVTADDERVIRGWSDALRRGDVDRAAGYWATPAIASNGGPPIRLVSRRAVRFFNESLPCGATLESATRDAEYVRAVFRLSERPGAGECGTGTGQKARTLFLLRDGKIEQWLRASDPRPPSQTPGGTES